MKLKKTLFVSMIAVAAAILAVAGLGPWRPETTVETARVRSGLIREYVDEQGRTWLPRTYLITMPYEGRIRPITLEEGDTVEAGQVVAQLVPEDLEIRLEEATASVDRLAASIREQRDTSVEEAMIGQVEEFLKSVQITVESADEQVKAGEAKLDFANRNLRRIQTLASRDAATDEELNRAETEQVAAAVEYQQDVLMASAVRSIQAAVSLTPSIIRDYIDRKELHAQVLSEERSEAEARLEQVRLEQQRATMTSPVDGVVLHREVSNERLLPAGAELLEIGNLKDLEVEADILTQDAVRIRPGQPVEVFGATVGPRPVPGTVRRIEPAGFTKVSSMGVEQQRVTAIISLPIEVLESLVTEHHLGVGYRVRVRILTAEASNALIVPRAALFRGLDGAWQVFAIRDGRANRITVSVGLMNDEVAQILDGLNEGELVVPAPEADLEEGDRVRALVVATSRREHEGVAGRSRTEPTD